MCFVGNCTKASLLRLAAEDYFFLLIFLIKNHSRCSVQFSFFKVLVFFNPKNNIHVYCFLALYIKLRKNTILIIIWPCEWNLSRDTCKWCPLFFRWLWYQMYIFVSLCCKPSVIYYTNWLSKITYLLSHPHRFTGVIKIVISKQGT